MPIEIQELSVEGLPDIPAGAPATDSGPEPAPDENETIHRWHLDAVVRRDRLRAD